MDVKNDPLQSSKGQKVSKMVDLIKSGETPKKAAKEVGLSLDQFTKDKELGPLVRNLLTEWLYNDVIMEATARAALLELGLTAEEETTRVSALKALAKGTRKDTGPKGPSTAIQIVVSGDVQKFIEDGKVEGE